MRRGQRVSGIHRRWPSPPVRVDYYTVQSSVDRWVVVATVENARSGRVRAAQTLVVGAATNRDDAIGDMVRQLTSVVAPVAAD